MDKNDLPLGFAFALAQNPDAMQYFSSLSESQKADILQRAQWVSSKDEMQSLVDCLSSNEN